MGTDKALGTEIRMKWRNKLPLPAIPAGTLQPDENGMVRGCVLPNGTAQWLNPAHFPDFFEPVEDPAPPKLRIVLEEVRRGKIGDSVGAGETYALKSALSELCVAERGHIVAHPHVVFSARIERADTLTDTERWEAITEILREADILLRADDGFSAIPVGIPLRGRGATVLAAIDDLIAKRRAK